MAIVFVLNIQVYNFVESGYWSASSVNVMSPHSARLPCQQTTGCNLEAKSVSMKMRVKSRLPSVKSVKRQFLTKRKKQHHDKL